MHAVSSRGADTDAYYNTAAGSIYVRTEIWWRKRTPCRLWALAYARVGSECRVESAREPLYSLHQGEIDLYSLSYRSCPGFSEIRGKVR